MTAPGPIFRVSNDEGWYRNFSFQMGAASAPPWAGVPAWAAAKTYGPSSACTYNGDLYVAQPGVTPLTWTSAGTFGADTQGGVVRWLRVEIGLAWMRAPYPLADATLSFAITPVRSDGTLTTRTPTLTASTEDGCFLITNAAQGGVRLAIPLARTIDVPAGLYAYAMYATHPDGRVVRLRYGFWTVDQGVA